MVVIMVSFVYFWFAEKIKMANKQRELIEVIEKEGGTVLYENRYLQRFKEWIDHNYFNTVIGVYIGKENAKDSIISHLNDLPNIRYLEIRSNNITESGLEKLKYMTQLQDLLIFNPNISISVLKNIKNPILMKKLIFCGKSKITLEYIKDMTSLRVLLIKGQCVSDEEYKNINKMTCLIELSLDGNNISDKGLKYFECLSNLESLSLSSTNITGKGLIHIKNMNRLRMLSISATKINNEDLVYIDGITNLQFLSLENTNITDAGLVHLKNLKQLYYLNIASTNVTDAGLEHLKGLPKLRYLPIKKTKITKAGMDALQKKIPSIKYEEELD